MKREVNLFAVGGIILLVILLVVAAVSLTRCDNAPAPTEPTVAEPTEAETQPTETEEPTEPPHVHEYEETVTDPDCISGGYTVFTCACGDSYIGDEIDAIGHVWKDATCTEPKTCTTCSVTEGRANGHKWDEGTVTIPAEEHKEGEKLFTCTVCKATKTQAIPTLDHVHNYEETVEITPPTCTEDGYTTHTCRCGDSKVDSEVKAPGHTMSEATCTKPEVCAVCGTTGKAALGHDWKAATCTEPQTCSRCATILGAPKGHQWQTVEGYPATCTEAGLTNGLQCAVSNCKVWKEKQTSITALGHSYVNGACIHCGTFDDTYSQGLAYQLSKDSTYYKLIGIGTCNDSIIMIPPVYNGLPIIEIQNNAFFESSIQGIVIPSSITLIGSGAFYNCDNLASVTIPSSIQSIGEQAFAFCDNLDNVLIQNGVSIIGNSAFYGCTSLTDITIPASVTSIGSQAFLGCSSLTGIWVDEGNNVYSSDSHGVLYNKQRTILIAVPETATGAYDIPAGVTVINDYAFCNCSRLTSVTLPSGLTSIGDCAFMRCSSIRNLDIPIGVSSIGRNAFSECTSLEQIHIPEGITDISSFMFYGCTSLSKVDIPSTVTFIWDNAFGYCTKLKDITIPKGVTCIGMWAVYDCSSLKTIYYQGTTEQWNTIYKDDYWDSHCTYSLICLGDSIISEGLTYALSSNGDYYSVTGIGSCTGTEIVIPDTYNGLPVKEISDYAFQSCTTLISVSIPNSVVRIGTRAFAGCNNITSVSIPYNVTSISSNSFAECESIQKLTVDPNNSVYHSDGNCIIKTETKLLVLGCKNSIIPTDGSVTCIGSYAFQRCTGLTNLTIPNCITKIHQYAFSNCDGLTNITIPNSVTIIDGGAFYYCVNLSEITLSTQLTYITNDVFRGCYSLTSITVPDGVTSLGRNTFASCRRMTTIIIPDTVGSIHGATFSDCLGLTQIIYNGTVTQWNKISKPDGWNVDIPAAEVLCSDGTVPLN